MIPVVNVIRWDIDLLVPEGIKGLSGTVAIDARVIEGISKKLIHIIEEPFEHWRGRQGGKDDIVGAGLCRLGKDITSAADKVTIDAFSHALWYSRCVRITNRYRMEANQAPAPCRSNWRVASLKGRPTYPSRPL